MDAKTSQGKIQNLENEKLDLERKIKIISEENSSLLNNLGDKKAVINDYEQKMRRLNDEISTLHENISPLECTITD